MANENNNNMHKNNNHNLNQSPSDIDMADDSSFQTNVPNEVQTATKVSLLYDIVMLIVIVIDLFIISLDLLLMSKFADQVAMWLNLSEYLNYYVGNLHDPIRVLGGFFTIFLIVELALRWFVSIIRKDYSKWFFFPFAHWYEVLGCFPQLRALRLLRAFFIGQKLYQLGYQVLPQTWIEKGKFYYDLVFEEVSDRVILTATGNIRQQFADEKANKRFIEDIFYKNRSKIQTIIATLLKQEVSKQLQVLGNSKASEEISEKVGLAIQDALSNTPELRRYLRLIPIAGGLIEGQLHTISHNIAENTAKTLLKSLTQPDVTEELMDEIAATIANISLDNPELDSLISDIVNDGLTAFEEQVKVQQWKHHEQLHF